MPLELARTYSKPLCYRLIEYVEFTSIEDETRHYRTLPKTPSEGPRRHLEKSPTAAAARRRWKDVGVGIDLELDQFEGSAGGPRTLDVVVGATDARGSLSEIPRAGGSVFHVRTSKSTHYGRL